MKSSCQMYIYIFLDLVFFGIDFGFIPAPDPPPNSPPLGLCEIFLTPILAPLAEKMKLAWEVSLAKKKCFIQSGKKLGKKKSVYSLMISWRQWIRQEHTDGVCIGVHVNVTQGVAVDVVVLDAPLAILLDKDPTLFAVVDLVVPVSRGGPICLQRTENEHPPDGTQQGMPIKNFQKKWNAKASGEESEAKFGHDGKGQWKENPSKKKDGFLC